MKSLVLHFTLLLMLPFSLFAQFQSVPAYIVPRAGEFCPDHKHVSPAVFPPVKGEPGYDSLQMMFQGNWSLGSPADVMTTITGDTAFIAAGGAVMILDMTSPSAPSLISVIHARALVDHLYYDPATRLLHLAAYFSGFEIWDLNNITDPHRLSRTPTEALPRGGIYSRGNYLYIITVADGMLVYDISDPASPAYITTAPVSGYAWNFFAKDNLIYVQTNNAIRLYDITNPVSPVLKDSYNGTPRAVFAEGNYAYIADASGLVILDASDPENLTLAGSLAIGGSANDVTVIGPYAYLANNWYGGTEGGLYTIDVSNPAAPVELDFYQDYYAAIAGVNNSVITVNNAGFTLFSLIDPAQPVPVYEEETPGFMTDIGVAGNYAFTGSNAFRVFDLTTKNPPVQVASVDIHADLVDISGNLAAFIPESMSDGNRLSIMDISDPLNPFETGHYSNLLLTQQAIIRDNYVYIAGWWNGFTVLDISDPSNPVFVTREFNWTQGGIGGVEWCYVSDLDVQGNYLYLVDYKPFPDEDTKGLYIFDISDPDNPLFVSRYLQQSELSRKLKVDGSQVFLADANGGLEIIDVSDPSAPFTLSYLSLPDVAYNLHVANGYVYAACYINGGVQVINISNPAAPYICGYYYRSGLFALNVTVDGSDVFISDGMAGMQIYKHLNITSIADVPASSSMRMILSPNPATDHLCISLDGMKGREDMNLEFFTMDGREVCSYRVKGLTKEIKIDTSPLKPGIYLAVLYENGKMVCEEKVMIR